MAGRGNSFTRNYSIRDTSGTEFPQDFILEEKIGSEEEGSECLYAVLFEEVNNLRRYNILREEAWRIESNS